MSKYAFIGAGNMGGAILRSALKMFDAKYFTLFDRDKRVAEQFSSEFGVQTAYNEESAALTAEYVFLCVKPQYSAEPLSKLAPVMQNSSKKTLVSIMAGVSLVSIREQLGDCECGLVRVMPNMPALIGKGMMAIADDTPCPPEVEAILKTCGEVAYLPEHLLEIETVAAACSPGYAFMFIEALADAGVYAGLSRADATKFAAAALYGAAAMVLEGGEPAKLKDIICSPGGSTIRGVAELENSGFRGAVMRAFKASFERFER